MTAVSTYSRILITGASGFIGCRLAEHLWLGHGLTVRGMIHVPARAVRLARLDVELVHADLFDRASLIRAVEGCDAVVHCAYGTEGSARRRRRVTGEATGALAEVALEHGVKRFVHLSSVAVWGFSPDRPVIDESVPVLDSNHPYVGGKVDAEREVAAAIRRGLPAVILRPTNVFGPFSQIFTLAPIRTLREGRVGLVGEGRGPANAVYVDNVVDAILRALESERALGETFIVSDDDGVTWREFYEAYARMASPAWEVRSIPLEQFRRLGKPGSARFLHSLLAEPAALARSSEAKALLRAAAEKPSLRALARKSGRLVPGGSARLRRWAEGRDRAGSANEARTEAFLPSEELARLQTSGVLFRTDKARSILGYEPPVRFDVAMRLTEEWLRFARLI